MPARTRIKQGVRALFAFSRPVDLDLAQRFLNEAELALFQQMTRGEQLHSLNVLREVLAQATHTPSALAVACLLHDVGKSRYPLAVWQKTLTVLTRKLLPRRFARWCDNDPRIFWSRAFVVSKHHPAWSADLLRECDSSEEALWLVAHHADPADSWAGYLLYADLIRLQRADDAH